MRRFSVLRSRSVVAGSQSCSRRVSGLSAWRRENDSSWRVSRTPERMARSIACSERSSLSCGCSRRCTCRLLLTTESRFVEVVRHAAGQLRQRLELLRFDHRAFHQRAAPHLFLQLGGHGLFAPRLLQRHPRHPHQADGDGHDHRGQQRDVAGPVGQRRGPADAGDDVDRIVADAAEADQPRLAPGRGRGHRVARGFAGTARGAAPGWQGPRAGARRPRAASAPAACRRCGSTRSWPGWGRRPTASCSSPGEAWRQRHRDDAAEAVVRRGAAHAGVEQLPARLPAGEHFADAQAAPAGAQFVEIAAVGHRRLRIDRELVAADQRTPGGVPDVEVDHRRQARNQVEENGG